MLSIAIRAVLLLLALSHIGPSLAADIADPPGGSGMAAAPWPAWTQFVPGGAVEARAIVPTERRCPTLGVSKASQEMEARGAPDEAFPVKLCRAALPNPSAGPVTVDGRRVKSLPRQIHRIVVIGDTGCRIEHGHAQACVDPWAWPFAAIARRAAAMRPDLVIHVGDYYYRVEPCPADAVGCKGSPHGDNWSSWDADFFKPAAPLLAAAPWVMVRGNHELCDRGGHGWFRLLDPHAELLDCPSRTEPYALHLSNLDLYVLDSADADDFEAVPEKVATYIAQVKSLFATTPQHGWLVTHRPVWALTPMVGIPEGASVNATLQAALAHQIPAGLDLVLSGHQHDFMSYGFGTVRPAQLVVGDSGDELFKLTRSIPVGVELDGMPVRQAFTSQRFGYFILDRAPDGWRGTLYAVGGGVLAHCRLKNRSLDCR